MDTISRLFDAASRAFAGLTLRCSGISPDCRSFKKACSSRYIDEVAGTPGNTSGNRSALRPAASNAWMRAEAAENRLRGVAFQNSSHECDGSIRRFRGRLLLDPLDRALS